MASNPGFPTIDVDATKVLARFKSIPEGVRNELRRDIPGITKKLAGRVREKLMPGALFKTTTRLLPAVRSRMIENAQRITGVVDIDPSKFPAVVANTLESGSKPHVIRAKNAGALFFFWEKLGKNVAFQSVNHPGFGGRSYMQSTFREQLPDITQDLRTAVIRGAQK